MTDDDTPPLLEDLNLRTVRAKNHQVDEAMEELEEANDKLRDEIAEKKATIEQLEDEAEAAKKLLEQFRDNQKASYLERIEQANQLVDDEDEADLSALEEATPDVLEVVADRMEKLAEEASSDGGVSNAGSGPDLSDVDNSDLDGNVEDEMAEVAKELGLAKSYEKMKNDDFGGPLRMGAQDEEQNAAAALQEALSDMGGDA